MKRLLIVALLTFSCLASQAQLAARVTAQWASWDAQITAASPSSPFMPLQDKVLRDSIYQFIIDAAALVASTGNLQAVMTLGNTTNLSIVCTTPGFSAIYNAAGFQEINTTTSSIEVFLGYSAGSAKMLLKDPSSAFQGGIFCGGLSAGREYLLPNEGNGSGVASTFVLHTTKDAITVTNGTASFTHDYSGITGTNGLGSQTSWGVGKISFVNGATNSMDYSSNNIVYRDVASTNTTLVGFITPTAPHTISFPDEGGAGLPGTLVTHSTKDSITVTGPVSQAASMRYNSLNVRNNNSISVFAAAAFSHGDYASGFGIAISWPTPTANRGINIPDKDGYIALLDDTIHAGTGRIVPKSYFDSTLTATGVITFTDRKTAQTGTATLASYTAGASDESLEVSANLLITTSTIYNFNVTVTYTDEGNTSRTVNLTFSNLGGTLVTAIANAGGAIPYEGVPLHIRAKSGSTVTVASAGTFTTVTYNFEEAIRKY